MKTINELSELYKDREGDILLLEKEDKKEIKKLLKEREEKNKQLKIALSNIPNGFKNIISNLNKAIEEKLEIENNINGYFNEKAYINGYYDAMKIGTRCIENDDKNENKRN